jgi:hypothetical protein
VLCQPVVSTLITPRIVAESVSTAIYLDRELQSVAVEIEDVGSEGVLAAKSMAVQLCAAKRLSEDDFRQTQLAPERPRAVLGHP